MKKYGLLVYVIGVVLGLMALTGGGDSKSHVLTVLSLTLLLGNKELFFLKGRGLVKWFFYACIGLFASSVVALIFSSTGNVGLNLVLDFWLLAVWFLASVNYFGGDEKRVLMLFRSLFFVACAGFLVGLYVYLFHPFNRFAGPFMHWGSVNEFYPNLWAGFCIMMFGAGVFAFWRSNKILGAVLMVMMSAGIFLSYSRGGIICFGILLILMMVRDFKLGVRVFLFAMLGVVAGEVINLFRVHETLFLMDKFLFKADEGMTSVITRKDFFKGAFLMFLERPLFGFGPDSFGYIYPRYQSGLLSVMPHPHNIVLKYAAELGVGGVLSLFLMLGICGYKFVRDFFKMSEGSFVAGICLVAVFGHQMIDYTFVPIMLILVAVYLGIFLGEEVKGLKGGRWMKGVFFLVILMGVLVMREGFYGLRMKNGDFEAGLKLIQEDYAVVEINDPERMVADFPNEVKLWLQWGDMLEGEEAIVKYLKALDLDPKNDLGVYARLCEVGYTEVDYEGVLEEYFELLRNNAFYTVLSDNPMEAKKLADCTGDELLGEMIDETFQLELSKLRLRQ